MIRYLDLVSDTVCAPITASGRAGVAVIRVSGNRASQIIQKITDINKPLQSQRVYLTQILRNDKPIDEVLVTYFKEGCSFTGDEVIEISSHGNPLVTNQIVNLLLENGCRSAEPGEFSFRAFYNGRIDLLQAESINSLIQSKNTLKANVSLDQLGGGLSKALHQVEQSLITVMAELEASIDFSEEDLVTNEYSSLSAKIHESLKAIDRFIESYDVGRNLDRGTQVLLLGPTNVGKSSLFNTLCKENLAIVTDVPGTTRDLLRGQVFVGPYNVEFLDSAGVRFSDDQVESIGISLSLEKAQNAEAILCVLDCSSDFDEDFIKDLPLEKTIFVLNKIDLLGVGEERKQFIDRFHSKIRFAQPDNIIQVSVLENIGLEILSRRLEAVLAERNSGTENSYILQARHYNHLNQCRTHLLASLGQMEEKESADIISQELLLGMSEVHQILGKQYDDEILDRIFSQFCIGK